MHHRTNAATSLSVLIALGLSLPAQKAAPSPYNPASAQPNRARDAEFAARSAPWQQFVQQAGGEWLSQWCAATGTPSAVYGSGLPLVGWRENSLEEARRHADQLLIAQHDLLGLGTSEFREIIGSRMGRTWSFVYDQFYAGLPVIDGRADVRVHMTGKVSMFGSRAWPIPAGFVTVPRLDELVATQIAWQAVGAEASTVQQPGARRAARLVIWGDIDAAEQAPIALAWEIPISAVNVEGQGPIGRSYIDANTGAVLHYASDKHECGMTGCAHPHHMLASDGRATLPAPINTTVTVMGWTRTGIDGLSALVNVPQAGLVLNVPGIGLVTTNSSGQFVINIAAPVSISVGVLDGRHHAAIAGANAPSGATTVNPGVATTIQVLTAAATTNQAAHTTTSWFTDRVNEYCRGILGNSAELNTADNVGVTVNIASTCNAYYTGNTINFYNAGGGCPNTAFSTVVAHEWGHGIDDRYGGISQTNGLSEGWGDICGCYLLDTPLLGLSFLTAGVALRDGNNTTQYPGGSGVHGMGQSWMGFAWKLRDRLATTLASRPAAIALTNDIVVGTLPADATNQQDAVLQVFIADDDDANLNNGTPHSVDLIWACNQHSLPYPGQPGLANNECAGAISLVNGTNGPFTSVGSTTSSAWPCASGGNDVWFSYYAGSSGTLSVSTCTLATWDTALQIFSGSCASLTSLGCIDDSCSLQSTLAVPVSAGPHYIRVGGFNSATGSFSLSVTGPAGGVPASTTPYGVGCYQTSKAFYELFATAASFDLNGARMRLTRNGNFYIASAAGTYVAPTGAATSLALIDDSITSVTLASPFPYVGGTTTTLEVCSNGFVSVATGNGVVYTPTAAGWLASVQPRWGTWHDHNPAIAGSGQVKFEQVGSISYVTWDGVYSFATTTPNTWQLQFDRTTGNVTYAWQTMSGVGNGLLVGYAAAAPNNDLGSMDISARLPATFRTNAENLSPLALVSTLPTLGSTATLTATNYPAISVLGVQVLSFVRHDPGLDLGGVGMPGCLQFTGTEATIVVLPAAGQSTYGLVIPNNPGYMGLPIRAQTYAFAPGANATGVIASNGVAMVVGI